MSGRIAVLWATTVVVGLGIVLMAGCQGAPRSDMKPPGDRASVPASADANAAAARVGPEADENAVVAEPTDIGIQTKVVAYYFHRTMRCPTCLSIEEQAHEAIKAGYGQELRAGRLEWHAINIEAPGNEHFEQDFELETSSLILAEVVNDEVMRWKNLTSVWELVEDPPAFQEYVWTELADFL